MKFANSLRHFLSLLVACVFIFLAFGTSEEEKQPSDGTTPSSDNQAQVDERVEPATDEAQSTSNENSKAHLINDGYYGGNSICTCCGNSANKPGNEYEIEIKNVSENKISFYNLEYQKREIIGNIENGKIIIDERSSGIIGLVFWGTVEIIDKNTIEIDIEWTDTSGPYDGKVLNHCVGTYQNTAIKENIFEVMVEKGSKMKIGLPSNGNWCLVDIEGGSSIWMEGNFHGQNGYGNFEFKSNQLPVYLGDEKKFLLTNLSPFDNVTVIFKPCEKE